MPGRRFFTAKHASTHTPACAYKQPTSSNGKPTNASTTKLRRLDYMERPMVQAAMHRLGRLRLFRLPFQCKTPAELPRFMPPMYSQRTSAHAHAHASNTIAPDTGAAHRLAYTGAS